ncbi:ABC transporter permease [Pararobbsia silviterrae]|uniref:STAS domain-containing protein n=1 Tax=Pararobbsia silviterrae TaxID=1792498 RepID=A0A494Y1E2_9BURK|nr:ABC transporter permease [Pararobbsia silviterrae]RKP56059.1 STAS domain-containing protein [Pararobbsia silviterrae]
MPSTHPPTLERMQPDGLRLIGDWTLDHFRELSTITHRIGGPERDARLDCSGITKLDTAGAQIIAALLPDAALDGLDGVVTGLRPAQMSLLRTVGRASLAIVPSERPRRLGAASDLFARVGDSVVRVAMHFWVLLGFSGQVLERLARTMLRPRRWRVTALVAQIEQIVLDAVPIVALLTFMVGAVLAFLGVTVLSSFGASIYAIDLVGFSFLREFGAVLASILMAGRTASAYAAQLGSMKINEEIDAIIALDLDPLELLVLPRVLAMVIGLPMLTFIAIICGLLGGGLVCMFRLGVSPEAFVQTLHTDLPIQHFYVGIAKTPVFAFVIACIGCIQGLSVGSSSESVGAHTTTSVVHSIFVVILLDAIAALFYMEMGW